MSFTKKTGGCAVLVFTLLLFSATAEEGAVEQNIITLTSEDAVQRAVKENISLKQKAITLNAAKRSSTYSWNGASPTVSASAGYSKANAADDGSVYVGGSVRFSLSPSLLTTIKGARLNYENGQLTYDAAVRSIELSVRKSYNSLLYEQENMNLLERNVTSAKKQYESNLAKYNGGTLPQLDVLNAQVTYQNSELSLESAKVTWATDIASFKQVLGIPLTATVTLIGSLQDVLSAPDVTLEGVTQNSATVTSIEKQLEIAENALNASRLSSYGPTVSLSWGYQPTASTADTSTWKDSGSLSLGVSIPLDGWLPWSTSALTIATQQDTVDSLKLQLEDAKVSVTKDTQSYLRKVQQSKASIALRQKSIDLAEKTYEMTLTAYNHGTKDLLSLQTASDNLFAAKVNLMSEAYNLSSSILDLENTIGVPFGTLTTVRNSK